MEFVPNAGQWPDQVLFRAEAGNATVWLEQQGITYNLVDPDFLKSLHPDANGVRQHRLFKAHAYRVRFVNSGQGSASMAETQSHYYNYYLGNDSAKWASNVHPARHAYQEQVYPGVRVHHYSTAQRFKYDFIVAPGADASVIRLNYEGDVQLSLHDGRLAVHTSVGIVTEEAPFAYQYQNGKLTEVPCKYVLKGQTVAFELGKYRHDLPLVIDPEISFSSFVGSSANNFGFTACDDDQGNLISGAAVFATGYPTTLGAFDTTFNGPGGNGSGWGFDAAISKFSANGSQLLYSTYLGGGSQDSPHSLVVNGLGQIIVMGATGSLDYPTTVNAYQPNHNGGALIMISDFFTGDDMVNGSDLFLTMINSTGGMAASTFLGGAGNDGLNYADQLFYNYGDAFRGEVNVDAANNVYVATVTTGGFPMAGGGFQPTYGGGLSDGVVLRMNPTLSQLTWSTYLGGSSSDACYAIQFKTTGELLIGGGTQSANFPHCSNGADNSHNGATDGFVVMVDGTSLLWSAGTFIGAQTNSYDQVYFVQSDPDGNVYALGQTDGTMPISGGCYGQGDSGLFIRKFAPNLSGTTWNTTIGTSSGNVDISPTAFLVSDCYQIYFSGWGGTTNSQACPFYGCQALSSTTFGLPVTADAYQSTTDGSDFYLCVLAPDATSLVYGTYIGGALSAEHVDGGTSRFDKNGSVYQAVCAGCQNNDDFPTTAGAWSNTNNSTGCNLAVFKFDLGQAIAQVEIDGPNEVCEDQNVNFINQSVNANAYQWSFGDNSTATTVNASHVYANPGTYTVRLIAGNTAANCSQPDTAFVTLTVLPGVSPSVAGNNQVCPGQSVQLLGTGTSNAFWLPNETLSDPQIPNPLATPLAATTYFFVDSNACEIDTVSITITPYSFSTAITPNDTICVGTDTPLQATITPSAGATFQWSPATGLSDAFIWNPVAGPTVSTEYTVTITTANGCLATETVHIEIVNNSPGGNIYPPIETCAGRSVAISANPAATYYWSPEQYVSNPFAQTTSATPPDTMTYAVLLTNACGQGIDFITVNVLHPTVSASGGGTICRGERIAAQAEGGFEYLWWPVSQAFPADEAATELSPLESRFMYVDILDENGCTGRDSVFVNVLPLPQVDAGPNQYFDFPGTATLQGNNFGLPFFWQADVDISCTSCIDPVVFPDQEKYFLLTVTDANGCRNTDSVLVVPYFPIWVPNTVTPNNDGINDVFRAVGEGISGYQLRIFDRWGILVFESRDIQEVWDCGINGYYVQNDTYVWEIQFDSKDRRTYLRGHVNVLR